MRGSVLAVAFLVGGGTARVPRDAPPRTGHPLLGRRTSGAGSLPFPRPNLPGGSRTRASERTAHAGPVSARRTRRHPHKRLADLFVHPRRKVYPTKVCQGPTRCQTPAVLLVPGNVSSIVCSCSLRKARPDVRNEGIALEPRKRGNVVNVRESWLHGRRLVCRACTRAQ